MSLPFTADSSEYLADCDARRAFISGFNGSAGGFPNLLSIGCG